MVREHASACDHERCRLAREAGQRVGGLDRERLVVE